MLIYGITDIQNKPSLIKSMDIAQIVDKRKNITLGYFISSKYEKQIKPLIGNEDNAYVNFSLFVFYILVIYKGFFNMLLNIMSSSIKTLLYSFVVMK